jgi:hypothetical protein
MTTRPNSMGRPLGRGPHDRDSGRTAKPMVAPTIRETATFAGRARAVRECGSSSRRRRRCLSRERPPLRLQTPQTALRVSLSNDRAKSPRNVPVRSAVATTARLALARDRRFPPFCASPTFTSALTRGDQRLGRRRRSRRPVASARRRARPRSSAFYSSRVPWGRRPSVRSLALAITHICTSAPECERGVHRLLAARAGTIGARVHKMRFREISRHELATTREACSGVEMIVVRPEVNIETSRTARP